jgi:hypothetical protein
VRRKSSAPELTLFPFLSVLAMVIGTLILISGMAQIALAKPKQRIEVDAFNPGKKSPIFVECRDNGLVIHADDPTVGGQRRVQRADIGVAESEWDALWRRVQHDPNHYIQFLVRESGVGAFNDARATIAGMGVEYGYEPLFLDGDLSFRNKRRSMRGSKGSE